MKKYDDYYASKVCQWLAEGTMPSEICQRLEIGRYTLWKWREAHPEFRAAYDNAAMCGAERLADEIISIADDLNEMSARVLNNAVVNRARLQTDVRRWKIGKLMPEQFGDSVALTGKGGKDLIPEPADSSRVPRLMAVLAIAMPDKTNTELHELATQMIAKVTPAANGHDQ